MIGEEIEYDKDWMKGFNRFIWLCCTLGIIVFSFLAYAGLVEKSLALGGAKGAPVSHHIGEDAVFHGYVFFTCAVVSFGLGFSYYRFKILIWIMIAVAWLCCLFLIHQFVV